MKSLLKPLIHLKTTVSKKVNPSYLKKKLEKRKGKCKKCGQCCKGCKFLNKETKLCAIYEKRRILCYQDFPLDRFDQKVWGIKNCGYHFQ